MHMFKDFRVSVKDAGEDADEYTFEGYASTFGGEPDCYGDVVAKGAFADTLKAYEDEGRRIPLLFAHEMHDPDYNLGYVDAAEDDTGLKVTGHIFADAPNGETVHKMLQRGQVCSMSFAYDVVEDGQIELEDGRKAHVLRKVDLYECSIVTVPANPAAQITDVKGGGAPAKECRRNSKADEDELASVRDLLSEALDAINDLIGDGVDPEPDDGDGDKGGGEGKPKANGGKPEEPKGDAKAFEEVAARYERFIDRD